MSAVTQKLAFLAIQRIFNFREAPRGLLKPCGFLPYLISIPFQINHFSWLESKKINFVCVRVDVFLSISVLLRDEEAERLSFGGKMRPERGSKKCKYIFWDIGRAGRNDSTLTWIRFVVYVAVRPRSDPRKSARGPPSTAPSRRIDLLRSMPCWFWNFSLLFQNIFCQNVSLMLKIFFSTS